MYIIDTAQINRIQHECILYRYESVQSFPAFAKRLVMLKFFCSFLIAYAVCFRQVFGPFGRFIMFRGGISTEKSTRMGVNSGHGYRSMISNLTSPSMNIPLEGGFFAPRWVCIHDTESSSQGASLQTKNLSLNRFFLVMRRT